MHKALLYVVISVGFLSFFSLSYSMDSDFPSGLPRKCLSDQEAAGVVVAQSRWPLGSFVFGRLCQRGAVPVINLSTGIDRSALFFQRKIIGFDKNIKAIIDPASGAEIFSKEDSRVRLGDRVRGMFRPRSLRKSCPKRKVFGLYDASAHSDAEKFIEKIKELESVIACRHTFIGNAKLSFVKKKYNISWFTIDKLAALQDKGKSFSGYMEKGKSFFGKHGFMRACAKKGVGVLGAASNFVGKCLVKSSKSHERNRGLRMWGSNLSRYGERSVASAYYDERKQKRIDGALSCAGRFVLSYMRSKTL